MISVTGSPGYSQEQIHDIAKLHPGDPVVLQRINSALERLRQRYQKKESLAGAGHDRQRPIARQTNAVDFIFDVRPGPTVEVID